MGKIVARTQYVSDDDSGKKNHFEKTSNSNNGVGTALLRIAELQEKEKRERGDRVLLPAGEFGKWKGEGGGGKKHLESRSDGWLCGREKQQKVSETGP